MARPNSLAEAALNQRVLRPVWFTYLDFFTDPLRASTLPYDVSLVATGDAELNGDYHSLDAKAVSMGEVHNQESGSETLSISLSGLILPDNDLLNLLGDRTNWHGRTARFWQGSLGEDGLFQGNIWHYHTGWMSSLAIQGDPGKQMILLQVESYLAMISNAAGRTYMDQSIIDPGDTSPELAGAGSVVAMGGYSQGSYAGGSDGGSGLPTRQLRGISE